MVESPIWLNLKFYRQKVHLKFLPVESPFGLSAKVNLVEPPIGLSTGRNSNVGDLGIALGSEI